MMRHYYIPIRTANIKKIIIKILIAGKDSEKLNLSHTIGGNVNGTATLEIHLVGFLLSLKWNMQFLYKPPITLLGLYLLWTECLCPHRIHMLKSQLPRWWYLEVGLWGRCSDHGGGSLMGRPSALKKEGQEHFSTPCATQDSRWLSMNKESGPQQTPNLQWHDLGVPQPPELWELNVCCLSVTQFMVSLL